MVTIKHNPFELTDDERDVIHSATWYLYAYGVGVIIVGSRLPDAMWDCSDTVGAKQYLDDLKILEL